MSFRPYIPTLIPAFFLLLLPFAVGCGNSGPALFENAEYGVSVIAPGHYGDMSDLNDEADISLGNIFKNVYFVSLSEDKNDLGGDSAYIRSGADLLTVSEHCIASFSQTMTDVEIEMLQIDTTSIPRSVRMKLIGHEPEDDVDIASLFTCVEGRRYFTQLISWTLLESFDEYSDEFVQIHDSFREVPADTRKGEIRASE